MSGWLEELKIDLEFVRGHTLQPKWYKALKGFLVLGAVLAYGLVFGWLKALTFLLIFLCLSLGLHLLYRRGTRRWQRSWLDFTVETLNGVPHAKSIGVYYYLLLIANALLSVLVSQFIPG